MARELISTGGMDASTVTGLQAQASPDPSALLASVGGDQEAGGGFGPLLGQLLSRAPDAATSGGLSFTEISVSDLLPREFTGTVTGKATEESSANSLESLGDGKGHGVDDLSRTLTDALVLLTALFSGQGNAGLDEKSSRDCQANEAESEPVNDAALSHEGLPQVGSWNTSAQNIEEVLTVKGSGTAPTVSAGDAALAVVLTRAVEGVLKDSPGKVRNHQSATTADERRGSTPILSGPDAGEALSKEAPVLAPAVALNAEEAKVSGSASSFRNIVSDGKAVRSGGAADVHRPFDAKGRATDLSAYGAAQGETASGESNRGGGRTSESISASRDTTDINQYRSESGGTEAGALTGSRMSEAGIRHNTMDMMPQQFNLRVDSSAPTPPAHVRETVRNFEVPGDGFQVLRHDEGSVEVSVKVDQLGKLRIELVMDDGVVNARIQTSDAAAKSLIENNLGQLLENLTREGVSIGNVAVSLREKREPSEENQSPRAKPDMAEVTKAAQDGPSASRGLVSIYA